jgi:hypothetical protein
MMEKPDMVSGKQSILEISAYGRLNILLIIGLTIGAAKDISYYV